MEGSDQELNSLGTSGLRCLLVLYGDVIKAIDNVNMEFKAKVWPR